MHKTVALVIVLLVGTHYRVRAADDGYRAKAVAFMSGNGGDQVGSKAKFSIKMVDLNGDGKPEALVIDNSPDSCGSHGCAANILDLTGPKARSMADLLGFDLEALPSKTGGWRDIALSSVQKTKLIHRGNVYVLTH